MDTLSPLLRFPSPFSSANSTAVTRIDNQRSATKLSPRTFRLRWIFISLSLSLCLFFSLPSFVSSRIWHRSPLSRFRWIDWNFSREIIVAETWPRLFPYRCWYIDTLYMDSIYNFVLFGVASKGIDTEGGEFKYKIFKNLIIIFRLIKYFHKSNTACRE